MPSAVATRNPETRVMADRILNLATQAMADDMLSARSPGIRPVADTLLSVRTRVMMGVTACSVVEVCNLAILVCRHEFFFIQRTAC